MCLQEIKNPKPKSVLANEVLAGAMSISYKENEFEVKYEEKNDLILLGTYCKLCGERGENGYQAGYDLYEDKQIPKDEIWIFGEDEVFPKDGKQLKVIKLFNFPM